MSFAGPPTFDLVVATVGRTDELERLLDSLQQQTHASFRVLVVDQNQDDRVERVLAGQRGLDMLRLTSERGLARARNVALPYVKAGIVAFPDDDCAYPPDLLERVAQRLADAPELDGLSGRSADEDGRTSPSWPAESALLELGTLWNRAISYGIFLRRGIIERVGQFDIELGLGATGPWRSGEETDYVIRAVAAGARIAYDPELVVLHEQQHLQATALAAIGKRDGASVGFLLKKHAYPAMTVARMFVRPVGGAMIAVSRGDPGRARFHMATLRGRITGYRGRRQAGGSSGEQLGEELTVPLEPGP